MSYMSLPKAAPFSEEDIEVLNRVVGGASPVQRAWLAGFLVGAEHSQSSAQPAAAPQAAEPLTIVYATESGNSEKLAGDAAKIARKLGFKPKLEDMADLELISLAKAKNLLVIAATWGEGEPPARATRAYNELMGDGAPKLDNVKFGVLALGDTAYADFCGAGKKLDERLAALGGKRVADRVDCDLDFEKPAGDWIEKALKVLAPAEAERGTVIAVDFASRQPTAADLGPIEAEAQEWTDLNSSQSEKETIHLELAFDGAAPAYKPGDSLDIYAENDPAYVESLLQSAGLGSDEALRSDFIKSRDITTLSLKTIENYVAATGHKEVRKLLDSAEAKGWIEGRQLIDLVEKFPVTLSAEQLRGVTRPLAPRAYSIASSRKEVGDEAHLLISTVRYHCHGRGRLGVASGFVGERLKKGDRVRVKVKPNKHFALPGQDTDIIMVGPGTGVAPFRSFVQERRGSGATGKNWLFFGDRSFTHDFLYQLEWQDALKDGSLHRMDIAFSRDTPEKVYVQNKLWERRRDVVEWLENGAHFYVCGDAKTMAKDVRSALSRAYADVKGISPEIAEQALQQLDREHRYLQDVY